MTEQPRLSRRSLLIGGAAVLAVGVGAAVGIGSGIVPGLLGSGGSGAGSMTPGPRITGEFTSDARLGATCGWTIAYPPGATPGDALPVLVVLHGFGGAHRTPFDRIGLDSSLAEATAAGMQPYAVAAVEAGNSYYHPRASGEDAGAMVTDEFLPLLAEQGLETERFALLGWSMGGYGALLLAGRLGAERVSAVVAVSPAMWEDFAQTPAGNFDDAADYARHDLAGRQDELDGIAVRIDCGTEDGFVAVARAYAAGFDDPPAGGFQAGGHDDAYWRRMAPDQLAFVGARLT